jgi:hypothetical protein
MAPRVRKRSLLASSGTGASPVRRPNRPEAAAKANPSLSDLCDLFLHTLGASPKNNTGAAPRAAPALKFRRQGAFLPTRALVRQSTPHRSDAESGSA